MLTKPKIIVTRFEACLLLEIGCANDFVVVLLLAIEQIIMGDFGEYVPPPESG